ncbi:MAG TPA: hypothetical protein VK171_06280 [Fimbriimonas sp.]|nr:hypothetical protein [Fimbriimonas sp.]
MAAFVGSAVLVTGTAQARGQGGTLAPFTQSTEKLVASQLREMLVNLGYEVKDLNTEAGKEKYSVTTVSAGLNIPVGFEISPSGSYIWQTVNLGLASSSTKFEDLLKQNGIVQPTFFYITKSGALMAAQAIDNRAMTPAVLKRCHDKIVGDVGKTKEFWQASAQ